METRRSCQIEEFQKNKKEKVVDHSLIFETGQRSIGNGEVKTIFDLK